MKKKKQFDQVVHFRTWNTDIGFFLEGYSIDAWREFSTMLGVEADEKDWEPANDIAFGLFLRHTGHRACGIWMPQAPITPKEHGTLTHESLHAAFHILESCGVEYCTINGVPNDEAHTYLAGAITEAFMEFCEGVAKSKRKRKKKK